MKASSLVCIGLLSVVCHSGMAAAADKVCKLEISGNDAIQYDKKELTVGSDCTSVDLTLHHTGKLPAAAMGHTWVLSKTADMTAVVNAGMAAGIAHNYQAQGDKRIIAATSLIGGGQSTSTTFSTKLLQKGGDYTYFCTFPGHSALMQGKLIFK
jgi:azurin